MIYLEQIQSIATISNMTSLLKHIDYKNVLNENDM